MLVLAFAGTARAEVLHDSTPSFGGIHPAIQDFETAFDANDTVAADDFTIPAGQTWTLQRVLVDGRDPGGSGPGTTDLVNIFLFNDSGTMPQASSFFSNQFTSAPGVYPDFDVALSGIPPLGPGTYWFGAQARLDWGGPGTNDIWLWSAVSVVRGDKAAYRNPGNGFGTGCTAFSIMETCVDGLEGKPDLAFKLEGACTGDTCPKPPVTPTPPAATPKKKCKKGQKLKKGKCVKKKRKKRK
jgi:hypothetical protein